MDETRVSTTELNELQTRLVRLERQARRTKRLALLIVLIAAASVAWAQGVPPNGVVPVPPAPPGRAQVLQGTELRLLDLQGRERVVITGGEYPLASFLDERGRTKLRVGMTSRGPTISFNDQFGKAVDLAGPFVVRPATQ